MRRATRSLSGAVLLVALATVPALAAPKEPRLALVIANAHYRAPADRLGAAYADAEGVATALEKVGFEVVRRDDLSLKELQNEVLAFRRKLDAAGPTSLGFFYYAGHGGSDPKSGTNYLIP